MNDDEMKRAIELAHAALRDEWAPNMRTVAHDIASALLASHAECERMRPVFDVIGAIRDDIDGAIAAHDPSDPRHPSHGGQHTNGRCCALGNLNPSAVRPLREWRDAIDAALDAARSEGERPEPIADLIARSSIGAGLRNAQGNGWDAEIADLDDEMHGGRR